MKCGNNKLHDADTATMLVDTTYSTFIAQFQFCSLTARDSHTPNRQSPYKRSSSTNEFENYFPFEPNAPKSSHRKTYECGPQVDSITTRPADRLARKTKNKEQNLSSNRRRTLRSTCMSMLKAFSGNRKGQYAIL